jgi:MFS family permease
MSRSPTAQATIRTSIPARLDRLNWSPFHTRMVAGLGTAWILDGLQITVASSVTGVLTQPATLGMTSTEVGLIASIYLVGELIGALLFGRLSDQLGRKRLLITTLLLYLLGTGVAAFVTGHHTGWLVFFYATRLVAGMGIGGQYAAINSAIDEMMPSRYRGRVDIWINGTYWAGAILGSFASLIFLNAFAVDVGWRLAFLLGPVLALVVIIVGRALPESPRWLLTHGRVDEAEAELAKIEEAALKAGQDLAPVDDGLAISVGTLLGPLVLGPFFDTVGRKKMISGTYILSGLLLAVSAVLFANGSLTATTQTLMWIVIFFFASAGASSAYLTVSETWPIEIRSEAIAVFFAIGTIAGALGPAFYGALIGDGSSRTGLFIGYLVGAAIMVIGGLVEIALGINAEGKSLESVTKPLTSVGADGA